MYIFFSNFQVIIFYMDVFQPILLLNFKHGLTGFYYVNLIIWGQILVVKIYIIRIRYTQYFPKMYTRIHKYLKLLNRRTVETISNKCFNRNLIFAAFKI